MRFFRALQYPAALALVIATVWIAAWERHITRASHCAFRSDVTLSPEVCDDCAAAAFDSTEPADSAND